MGCGSRSPASRSSEAHPEVPDLVAGGREAEASRAVSGRGVLCDAGSVWERKDGQLLENVCDSGMHGDGGGDGTAKWEARGLEVHTQSVTSPLQCPVLAPGQSNWWAPHISAHTQRLTAECPVIWPSPKLPQYSVSIVIDRESP